jgi:hypothetical protein
LRAFFAKQSRSFAWLTNVRPAFSWYNVNVG